MIFSDTTNKNGIIQQVEFRINIGDTGISGDATLLAQITGQVNDAYYKATNIIMSADGRWKWDDTNHTGLPSAITDLTVDINNYLVLKDVPDSGQDWLRVERVEIKDESGNWIRLKQRDLRTVGGSIMEERTTTGIPSYFDFDGSVISLDSTPSYSSTGGLKLWFSRSPLEFTATGANTKRPGFVSTFHEYLVLVPVYIWEKYKGVGNPEQTKRDIVEMEEAMRKFYGSRDKTQANYIRRASRSFK